MEQTSIPLDHFDHLKKRCSSAWPRLETALYRSEQWMVECALMLNKTRYSSSNRLRVVMALQHLCLEHHQGIHVLVSQGVIGSALALLRPQFETYVRGAWFYYCASDNQIKDFLKGNDPPRFGILIQDLEKVEAFDGGTLSELKKAAYKNLCDFTHGGTVQVKARNSSEGVISNYLPEHVINTVETSTAFSLQAAVAMAIATEDNLLVNKIFDRFQEIHKEG